MRVLACLLVLQQALFPIAHAQKGERDVAIEHAMKVDGLDPVYTKRGTLRQQGTAVSIEQNALTEQEAADLVAAVKDNAYYYIRVPSHPGEDNKEYVSTLVKACTLVSSKLKDQLTIHYSPKTGAVIGLDYIPSNHTCANKAYLNKIVEGATFKTTIMVNTKGKPGPTVVLTADAAQQQQAREQQAQQMQPVEYDAEGNPIVRAEQEPSFFGKYWMYIIPAMFLFNTLTSQQGQQQQEGGQPQQGGGRRAQAQ